MKKINIIYSNNNWGLTKDCNILQSVLVGYEFNLIDFKINDNLNKADINIFLEVLDRNNDYFIEYKKLAPKNVLIPNPEWFLDGWIKYLKDFDLICCKTLHAFQIFSKHSDKCEFTSFTADNIDLNYVEKELSFFHSCGNSVNKGTDLLFEGWKNIKEKLYLFSKRHKSDNINIELRNDFVPDKEFQEIKNKVLFHIYPTKYEGFGHNIWESFSCGAIVILTDAPPLNEYNANFYIKATQDRKFHQVFFNKIDITDLRLQIKKISELELDEIIEMSNNNKQNYIDNHKFFTEKINECIKTL